MQKLKHLPLQILWHDGMLLAPQHFQQAFQRTEDLIRYHHFQLTPYPFGVQEFQLNESAFLSGLFKIEFLECIFPDGLEFYFNAETEPNPLEIKLEKYQAILNKHPLTLFLCVPRAYKKTLALNTKTSRYVATHFDASTVDANTGEDEIFIPRMKPRVNLHFEHELHSDFTVLPLAKICCENDVYKLIRFAPPTTQVLKKSLISELCQELCLFLKYKIQDLKEDLHKFDQDFHKSIFFGRHLILRSIKSALPRFEAYLHSSQIHPFSLYLEIYNLLASLIANDPQENLPSFIAYDHLNTLSCFEEIKKNIVDLLEKEVPMDFQITKLIKKDNNFSFYLNSKNFTLDDDNHILLGFKKSYHIAKEKFIEWIKATMICKEDQLTLFLERRTLGYQRTLIDSYETLIPPKNIFLLLVKLDSSLKEKTNLMISSSAHHDPDIFPEEIIIYSRKNSWK
jgi:type VI secretion system protein ImpJ